MILSVPPPYQPIWNGSSNIDGQCTLAHATRTHRCLQLVLRTHTLRPIVVYVRSRQISCINGWYDDDDDRLCRRLGFRCRSVVRPTNRNGLRALFVRRPIDTNAQRTRSTKMSDSMWGYEEFNGRWTERVIRTLSLSPTAFTMSCFVITRAGVLWISAQVGFFFRN